MCALSITIGAIALLGSPARAGSCPAGMARVGKLCVDRYEASVWSKPDGGIQYGVTSDDYPCANNGQDCDGKIFARSVKGVPPSRGITWFQAQAALSNSGKRFLTNAEWQAAAQGTPDPGTTPGGEDCNTNSSSADPTGSRSNCVSDHRMHDMVGNAIEWVADWVPWPSNCGGWPSSDYNSDQMCFMGSSTSVDSPGAVQRGGAFNFGAAAGVFAIAVADPTEFDSSFRWGFRGAR